MMPLIVFAVWTCVFQPNMLDGHSHDNWSFVVVETVDGMCDIL